VKQWTKALRWILIGCASVAGTAFAQEQPPRLFKQVQAQEPPSNPGPWLQTWQIEIDQQAIQQPAEAIILNLPGQREITVRRDFWSPRQGYMILLVGDGPETIQLPDPNAAPDDFSWRWYGRTDGHVVALTFEKGYLAGRIWGPGGKYALNPRAGKRTELGLVNPGWWQLHPDREDLPQVEADAVATPIASATTSEQPAGPGSWNTSCPDPLPTRTSVIDVLVMYTPTILSESGSIGGLRAVMQREVDEANQVLRNTLVSTVRFNLKDTEAVPGDTAPTYENTPLAAALARLSGTAETPGVYPGRTYPGNPLVRARRDAHAADVVALARRDPGTLCGVAFVQRYYNYTPPIEPGPEFERKSYMVFDPNCSGDRLNLAHELGHLLGMEHDPRNAGMPGNAFPSCPWSFGHRYATTAEPRFAFRTVMSYWGNGGGSSQGPSCSTDEACPLIDAFSNPALEWAGIRPPGASPSDPYGILPVGTYPGSPSPAKPIGRNINEPPTTYGPSRAYDTLARIAPIVEAFRARHDGIFANGFQ